MTAPANFSTPQRIIRDAMGDAGLLMDGADPNSEQFANYGNRLKDVINTWQTQGLKLWTQVDQAVTLIAGQAAYTFKPSGDVNMVKPLRALQGYYLSSASGKTPIYPISRDEYMTLSTNTEQGAISQFFVDKLRAQLTVYFWLVPDATAATGTAHLLLQQQIANFTGLTDTLDFPIEWYMALRWGLADDICTGQPEAIMTRCAVKAAAFRAALEDWDVEDASTRFQPDSRAQYSTSRFR